MKARIIRVGNSRGVRLPRPLLREAQLQEEVELEAELGRIIVRAAKGPRAGWAEAARRMRERGDDRLLDHAAPTRFDEREWKWR